ncbi:hypothetical protein BLNAU_8787 [Blattamonas nauphoetae]|uniref:Uncharacterized protein n=1 Tax=Blattamonas nauphoetae TaxID=2049346 RepID=A0ABQ9XXK2_9EUKA|nr:hypothetical protein BLNAU_8787 [Blattamonas nauphoetae]
MPSFTYAEPVISHSALTVFLHLHHNHPVKIAPRVHRAHCLSIHKDHLLHDPKIQCQQTTVLNSEASALPRLLTHTMMNTNAQKSKITSHFIRNSLQMENVSH